MFQLLATTFFALALIAPLAVIILTLHNHWSAITRALMGAQTPGASYSARANHVRRRPQMAKPSTTMTIRRVAPVRMPLRAAA